MADDPRHNPNLFDPPSAEQLTRHLNTHPPAQADGWPAKLPQLLLIAMLGLLILMLFQPAFALLPMIGLVCLTIYQSRRTRTAQTLEQRVTRLWELAMIRRYREALGEAWRLLPECRSNPDRHGRVVTVLAHILNEIGRNEAAEIAYGYLLDRLPTDHPLSLRLRIQRAIAALLSDRLADADDALRRLRGQAQVMDDPTLLASYTLARLLQDVRTGHYAEAVSQAEDTAEALKPLGVEAGYGHGLIALCYYQLASRKPEHASNTQSAKQWWDQATLLLPAAALLVRYPELRPVHQTARNTP